MAYRSVLEPGRGGIHTRSVRVSVASYLRLTELGVPDCASMCMRQDLVFLRSPHRRECGWSMRAVGSAEVCGIRRAEAG